MIAQAKLKNISPNNIFTVEYEGTSYLVKTDSKAKVNEILSIKNNKVLSLKGSNTEELINQIEKNKIEIKIKSSQEQITFEELFYNDYNFEELQKELIKNLDLFLLSQSIINISFANWLYSFTNKNLRDIFKSENISEKNKIKFWKSIIYVLKKKIIRQIQKWKIEKENTKQEFKDKLSNLGLSNLEKYFPEENFKYWFYEKIKNLFF